MLDVCEHEQRRMRSRTASHCVFASWGPPIDDIHPGPFEIPTMDLSAVTAYARCVSTSCLKTLAASEAPSYCLALRIRGNAPMLWNRGWFRHFASPYRLGITIRSVFGEMRHNLRVLALEMRHHSRCRKVDHAGASSSIISRPCTLRYKPTQISTPRAASPPK